MTTSWTPDTVAALYDLPVMDLVFQAQSIHRQHFDPNKMQLSTLFSIKTGACPEDCKYCAQSGLYNTGIQKEKLLPLEEVLQQAQRAKELGSTRFCMGAGWRNPPKKELPKVCAMIKAVKDLGLETCATLGMLDEEDAAHLKEAGLDYYNHNLDTSREFYSEVITSRTYQDRLDTLRRVQDAGINVCCGGILGLGETRADRIGLLLELNQLPEAPKSIPINKLAPIAGTPLENAEPIDDFEILRMIAVTRIMFPKSHVRLTAGRNTLSEAMQTLCFLAGANSIFFNESGKLFTAENPGNEQDNQLLEKLGMQVETCDAAA
jgi:biotin synthase